METENDIKEVLLVQTNGKDFLLPYFEREWGKRGFVITDSQAIPTDNAKLTAAVCISSTDVYDIDEGFGIDEQAPVISSSPWLEREREFTELCKGLGVNGAIIRCAEIVGTGMNGFAMRLAKGIARGTLMHIAGNDGQLSVVHAVDVSRFGIDLADKATESGSTIGPLNLTDGNDTKIDDLINALAFRIKDKDVFTIKNAKLARLIYGGEFYGQMTRRLTFSNAAAMKILPGVDKPVTVTEYLRTHNYDSNSL